METIINFVNAAVLAGTPLLFGTLGEILTEKSGQLNLGVEGMMFMGAVSGLAGAWYAERWFGWEGTGAALVALLIAFLAGALGALIYAFLTVTLRANQNVTGLTLTIFGTGFANFFGELMGKQAGGFVTVKRATKFAFDKMNLGKLSELPVVGKLLFSYNWLVYLSVVVAICMHIFLRHTRKGLNLRAVGESPATADAAGINVTRYKYLATVIGGGICGIGGMYMTMVTTKGVWVHNTVQGYGWLAVALVIFATWSPARAMYCGLIFGGLMMLRLYLPIPGLPRQIYDMLPYFATIVVLVTLSIRGSKEHAQPNSTGLNYFREER